LVEPIGFFMMTDPTYFLLSFENFYTSKKPIGQE